MDEMDEQELIRSIVREQNERDWEYIKETLGEDFERFREFLEKPETFPHSEFYAMLHQWGDYVIANKERFDYGDDRWWKPRERIREDFIKREAIPQEVKDEIEAVGCEMDDITDETPDEIVIDVLQRWIYQMKKYQTDFRFSDEDIANSEAKLDTYIKSCEEYKIVQKAKKSVEAKMEKSLEQLEDAMFKEYERTGKMPVLPFRSKKRHKGN